jgi:hypothetical protein
MAHFPAQPEPAKNGQTVTRLAEVVKYEDDWQRMTANGSDCLNDLMGGTGLEHLSKPPGKTALLKLADAKSGALDARLTRIIGLWPRIDRAGQRRLLRLARRLAKG